MLTEVKNNFKFLFKALKYNILSALEYKKSFLIQVIFMFINNGFFLVFWNVVFAKNGGTLNNIEMKDIYILWAIPVISWGIYAFFFGGVLKLNEYIKNGNLDTFILQPKNMFLNIATSYSDFGAAGDLLYGLLMGVIAAENLIEFLHILVYVIPATIITICTQILIRVLAIWLGDVENIAHVYSFSLFITFSTYPEQIFSNIMKVLFYTVVPVAYVVYIPIRILNNFDIKLLLAIILFTILLTVFTAYVFKKAMKKYESGNSIAMKG